MKDVPRLRMIIDQRGVCFLHRSHSIKTVDLTDHVKHITVDGLNAELMIFPNIQLVLAEQYQEYV